MSDIEQTSGEEVTDLPEYCIMASPEELDVRNSFTDPMVMIGSTENEPIAEEYRKLKSTLMQTAQNEGLPYIILVASTVAVEGKSITAINLALNLAKEHTNTVIIVDADLRKPSLGKYLNIKSDLGLADCLRGTLDFRDALVHTGIGDLMLLPAGKRVANPMELFSSQRLQELLKEMRQAFPTAIIVIDTSPLLLFAEGRILSSLVNGVLFVVKANGANKHHITEALGYLKDANVLGLVCNKAEESILDRGYYYYNYYFYYANAGRDGVEGVKQKQGLFSRLFRRPLNK